MTVSHKIRNKFREFNGLTKVFLPFCDFLWYVTAHQEWFECVPKPDSPFSGRPFLFQFNVRAAVPPGTRE
jgi:hypothetical protein